MSKDTINNVQCPACDSNAIYRDGLVMAGKQRYLCLMCGMQFTNGHRTRVKKRPQCVACGNIMHLYKDEQTTVRFRCSRYPDRRTYTKVPKA
jgi:transposase-like protein